VSGERAALARLCAAAGIETGYHDIYGAWHEVPEWSLRALLEEFEGAPAPPGRAQGAPPSAAAPARCHLPDALAAGRRLWGVAVQLYGVRSGRNWGIGDFGDLARLAEDWAARGAALVGLNPVHALFPHDPEHASPYSPSSRERLNVLYLDVEAIEDFGESERARAHVHAPPFQARLAGLRDAPLVDYAGVARAKFEALELLYAHFRERHLARGTARAREFRGFQSAGGDALRRHALCEALLAHFPRADPAGAWGWPAWPEAFRDPGSEACARFCAGNLARVEFFEYLQWQAEAQLARAAARARAAGLALGLYLDLALSVERAGSDCWAERACYATGVRIGAPPDDFNANGQDWGLPPLRPDRLRERGYAPFARALRGVMRHSGAIRIDHVMGLMRLFWIPGNGGARDGAYVRYPLDELLALVALESERHRCLVVGEDLGTVPDEVRAAAARAGLLSTRLFYFERAADGEFRRPAEYPRDALVAVATHDLPTLAGWWARRPEDRERLLRALERERLRPEGCDPGADSIHPAAARAVHAYLARTPARLMMVQLEDALGLTEQANVPGTVREHPNWRRKLPATLEEMTNDPRLRALAETLCRERS
jgi:(1->4)-alpha-D-glucan 1-alpha-D-glucosylmutase